ncbi:MAG: plastocyanin/azurin family copper-binding protein [Solirubrobacterales bacterium]
MTASWDWKARWTFVLLVATIAVALIAGDRGSASGASGATRVDIAHFAFHPPTLRVKRGARVAFVNSSRVAHTATRAGSFNTGHIKPGTSVVVRFEHKGTFAYHCSIHPFMKGTIVVE